MSAPALFADRRPAPLSVLALFLLAHAALKAVFFSDAFYRYASQPVAVATGGLVTPVLLCGLVSWVVLVGVVLEGAGRLRLRELGLDARDVPNAALLLLLLWGVVQVVLAAVGQLGASPFTLNPSLDATPAVLAGRQLEALFGSGLLEEVLYRGFLLVQVFLLLRRRMEEPRALAWAIAASSLYFGLNHLPAALRMHLDAGAIAVYLVHVALVGALFAWIYLRTGNLWLAGGAHALINYPAALFVSWLDASLLVLVATALLLLAWPALHRRFDRVFTVHAAI